MMKVPEFFRKAVQVLISLFYPDECLLCGAELDPCRSPANAVCPGCKAGLVPINGRRCTICGTGLISEFERCLRCREADYAFDRHRALFDYAGDARELVYYYKFTGKRRLGVLFADFFALADWSEDRPDFIVPVPSNARSVKKRGFNHIGFLARKLSRKSGVPVLNCLKRKPGRAQKSLNLNDRLANLKGLILYRKNCRGVRGRHVLLLDDVFTTGATAHECALVLKRRQARIVSVMTIAMD